MFEVRKELGVKKLTVLTHGEWSDYNYKGIEVKVLPVFEYVKGL